MTRTPLAAHDAATGAVGVPSAWDMAGVAAAILAVAPHALGGAQIKAPAGPVRDVWLKQFLKLLQQRAAIRRMPSSVDDDRLLGGLDLAATLARGGPVAQRGLLAECDQGILIAPMAERIPVGTAASIASALDNGRIVIERDGIATTAPARASVIALDESEGDDLPMPFALSDRLTFQLDLRALSHRNMVDWPYTSSDIEAAQQRWRDIGIAEDQISALAAIGEACGIPSVRTLLQAATVARITAALNDQHTIGSDELSIAAALVFAPRATRLPSHEQDETTHQPEPQPAQNESTSEESSDDITNQSGPLDDVILDAAVAAIPAGLLAQLTAPHAAIRTRRAGKAGAQQKMATRGRKIGSRPMRSCSTARIDLVATLKAAAPWQKLRRLHSFNEAERIRITRDDLRMARYRHRTETTTIFVVDASGSSALQRLAEAKGAIRILLSECYIRRDEVALIAFRGQGADLLLPPTRALTHAQRALAALPGGGGTPVASGIIAAHQLATHIARDGRTPAIVMMTDGKANIARDGSHGRPQALEDAHTAARALARSGFATLLIDTSPQPQPLAAALAKTMLAQYLPLPRADARTVASAIQSAMPATAERSAA